MINSIASPSLATISYRIVTEPDFIQKLKSMLKLGRLDSGQVISEEEAAALKSYFGLDTLASQATEWVDDPTTQDTWWL